MGIQKSEYLQDEKNFLEEITCIFIIIKGLSFTLPYHTFSVPSSPLTRVGQK